MLKESDCDRRTVLGNLFWVGVGVIFKGCASKGLALEPEKENPHSDHGRNKQVLLSFNGSLEKFVRKTIISSGAEYHSLSSVIHGGKGQTDQQYLTAAHNVVSGASDSIKSIGKVVDSSNFKSGNRYGALQTINSIIIGGLNKDGTLCGNKFLPTLLGAPINYSNSRKVAYLKQNAFNQGEGKYGKGNIVGVYDFNPRSWDTGNCLVVATDSPKKIEPLVDRVNQEITSFL